jgi:Flavodoxin
VFLEVASIRLAAMESAVKVTVVYESMFGNTRNVAEAISDGVREAYPDAHVECVAVGRASAELIYSTDLLIVGGPTHLRRMTTDSSRNRHISRQKKAQANGGPPRELEPDAEGPSLREWFYPLWPDKGWRHAAAFDTRVGSVLVPPGGACYGIARKLRGHGYELVTNPPIWARGPRDDVLVTNREGFILDDAYGPLRAGEVERAKEWGAQLVRTSVAHPEGWAIWDRRFAGNE